MRVSEVHFDAGRPVEGYGPGFFRVGGGLHEGPLLLLPVTGVTPWAGFADLAPILAAADGIDVLFVGTGAEIGRLGGEVLARLEAVGLGVEVMATPPAARTYNVLLAEGRRIGAALIPV